VNHFLLKFLIILICSSIANASAALLVSEVIVECGTEKICKDNVEKFKTLKTRFRNTTHLRQNIKTIISNGGFKNFHWKLEDGEDYRLLKINFTPKRMIGSVKVKSKNSALKDYVERNTRLKQMQWYEEDRLNEESLRLKQFLSTKGYPETHISYKKVIHNEDYQLEIRVNPGRQQILKKFAIQTGSKKVKDIAYKKLVELQNKTFDVQVLRSKIDELESELFSYGYYLVSISINPIKNNFDVYIDVTISGTELWAFNLKSPPAPHKDVKIDFGQIVKDIFKRFKRPIDHASLMVGIQDRIKQDGYLNPKINLSLSKTKNLFDETLNLGEVFIDLGVQTRLENVRFSGSQVFSEDDLLKMWKDQSGELSDAGFFDEASQNRFSEWLRAKYIELGYVRVKVPPPRVFFHDNYSTADIEYNILEGSRVIVDEIKFSGLTEETSFKILDLMKTKTSNPFNPNEFTNDLKVITDYLQSKGWFYAEVSNRDLDSIVTYGADRSSVKIHIKINKNKYITFNKLIIVGTRKTRFSVIKRKSPFERGVPITPTEVRDYESMLSGTGLFSSVRVKPIIHNGETALTDLVVEVVERDYGLIEIAPGYRTDLGIKLSGTVSYMNIFGENVSTSLTGQVNQRLDFQALDSRRRKEGQSLLEYNLTNQLNVPDLFDSYVDYGLSLSAQRRRFFSFDADIQRISNTFTKDFGPIFSMSLRHQFESISQFDATEDRDNGNFVIGALTPSLTVDLRNSRINPTSGAWFNVSNEFANPLFLSQREDDLVINFYKLIMRNRFYIPIPNGTIAISLVGGLQENLSKKPLLDSSGNPIIDPDTGQATTEGYIPNIKLFRLTGTDIVRGYSDEEINRLPDGNDIGVERVQGKAYMANFKLEPRYFINDALMAGVFYDAGRIYRDTVDLGDLRESVGLTFKIVTPVGTLDFDYGIKLLRKRGPDGTLEAPGRFHVSIGFF
jgi:outer membrane protein insertion porin family